MVKKTVLIATALIFAATAGTVYAASARDYINIVGSSTVYPFSTVVAELAKMIRRVIGEDISLEIATPRGLPAVRADRHQMEHALMNLVVNARDAMPNGGRLRIEVALMRAGEAEAEGAGVREGPERGILAQPALTARRPSARRSPRQRSPAGRCRDERSLSGGGRGASPLR